MKPIINLCICLLAFLSVSAQDTTYHDLNFDEVSQRREAHYYETVAMVDGLYSAVSYYMDGTVQKTGTYLDAELEKGVGEINYYYDDGSSKTIEKWEDGVLRHQLWKYPDGGVKSTGSFNGGRGSGFWMYFQESGDTIAYGNYVDGEKDGDWTMFDVAVIV